MIMCNKCGSWQEVERESGIIFPDDRCEKCDSIQWDWQSTTSLRTYDRQKAQNRSRKTKKKFTL